MMASPWPGLVTYVMVSKPTLFLQAFPRGGQGECTGSAHEGPMCSPGDRSHIKRNSGPPQSWCCRMETESACTYSILPGSSKTWKHAFLLLVPSPFVPHMVGLTPVYSRQSRTFVCLVTAKANTRLFISAIIDRKEGFGSDGFHLFITMWFFSLIGQNCPLRILEKMIWEFTLVLLQTLMEFHQATQLMRKVGTMPSKHA